MVKGIMEIVVVFLLGGLVYKWALPTFFPEVSTDMLVFCMMYYVFCITISNNKKGGECKCQNIGNN